jgi:hypothetical protein
MLFFTQTFICGKPRWEITAGEWMNTHGLKFVLVLQVGIPAIGHDGS